MTNRLLLAVAIVALAACSKEEPAANAANAANTAEAPANAAEPVNDVAAAAPAAAPGAITADFLVGKWSAMDQDCSDTIEFRKDGVAVTPIGEGKWTLNGDQLSLDYGGQGGKMDPSKVEPVGADKIKITRPSGGSQVEKRC